MAEKFVPQKQRTYVDHRRVKENEKIKRKNCSEFLKEICWVYQNGIFSHIYGFNKECIMTIHTKKTKGKNPKYIYREDAYVPISSRQYGLFKRLNKSDPLGCSMTIDQMVLESSKIAVLDSLLLEKGAFREKSFRIDLWKDPDNPLKKAHYFVMTAVERSYAREKSS